MKRLVLICAVMLGCGGGGPPNPPSPPGPTPLSFSNVQAANIATNGATISWNTNKNASSKVRYGTSPANLNLETPEDNAMVTSHSVPINSLTPGTQYHYSVVSRDTDGTVGSSNGFNFTTAQMTPPVLTFVGPDTVTVNPGASQQFTFTLTGSPAPTVDCSATLGTIVGLSGNMVTYRAPTPASNVSDTLTCTADNGINPQGVDSITIIVPFTPNGPVITSIEPEHLYFRDSLAIQGMVVHGGNFTTGLQASVNYGKLLSVFLASSTELNIAWAEDTDDYHPGDVEFTLSGAAGTATEHFLFKGNFDTMVCSQTECFQVYDQAPGSGNVYDRTTGSLKRTILPTSTVMSNLTWDNGSGDLAFVGFGPTVISTRAITGEFTSFISFPEQQSAVFISEIVARDGSSCSARDEEGRLAFFDMTVDGPTPLILSPPISGKPTPVAMGKIGSQLVCATFSVEDLKYTALRIPQNTILGQSTLQGLHKASGLGPAEGGWRLKLFSSGSAAGIAALLHDEDKVVVFLNASTGAELRRVSLSGIPFRMEADEANGQVIIANWDSEALKTRFNKVKVSNGQISSLSGTVNFASTGMEVCGSFVCAANRDDAFAKVTIN